MRLSEARDRTVDGEVARRDELTEVIGRLADERADAAERGRLLTRLARLLGASARTAGAGAAVTGRWLVDVVTEIAPHIPVRDLDTLREHHDGRTGDALADELIRSASRVTAAIGGASGALAAVEFAAPPTLLAAPVQIAASTVAAVAVELKLVAELHVVYGRAPLGTRREVATAYLTSWITRQAYDPRVASPSLAAVLGVAAKRQLRSRIARRTGRNLTTLAPFLAGAAAGAELNRRETRGLGEKLARDLRRRR